MLAGLEANTNVFDISVRIAISHTSAVRASIAVWFPTVNTSLIARSGSCAWGSFPEASREAYPLARPLFAEFSGVNPRAFCFPFHVLFSVSVTNRYEADWVISEATIAERTEGTPEASLIYPDPPRPHTVYPSVAENTGICHTITGVPTGCIPTAVPVNSIRTLPVIGFTLIGIGVFQSAEDTQSSVDRPFASCRASIG